MLATPTTRHPAVSWIQQLWQTHPPLFVSGALTALLGLFFLAGIFLDERYITGAPAWLKPLKFSISISVYTFTLLWMLGFIEGRRRLVRRLAWTVLLMLALEWVALIIQAARGVGSHFNYATPLDTALYIGFMGVPIFVTWIATAVIAFLLLRQTFTSPVLAWGLRLGIAITLVGMAQGGLMTQPTAQQLAGLQAGESLSIMGAHAVGAPEDAPGLPVVGWSTRGGDLRVGHFVGLHALQVLPLLALVLLRWTALSTRQQVRFVWIGGAAYLGLTVLVTWQALRAQPLLAPDGLTLGTLALLLAGTLGACLLTLRPEKL